MKTDKLKFRVDVYRNGAFASTAIVTASKQAFEDGTLYWQREWKTARGTLSYRATPLDDN
jgi:hypothetical protein